MPEVVTKCPKCGAGLVNIVSGSVCPEGCGGVHPRVSSKAATEANRASRMKTMPQATEISGVRISGTGGNPWTSPAVWAVLKAPGLWRRVRRDSQSLDQPKTGDVLAVAAGRPLQLRRDKWLEAALELALGYQAPPDDVDETAGKPPEE